MWHFLQYILKHCTIKRNAAEKIHLDERVDKDAQLTLQQVSVNFFVV